MDGGRPLRTMLLNSLCEYAGAEVVSFAGTTATLVAECDLKIELAWLTQLLLSMTIAHETKTALAWLER